MDHAKSGEPDDERMAELLEAAILGDADARPDPNSAEGGELAEFLPLIEQLRSYVTSDAKISAYTDLSDRWPFIGKYRVTGLLGRGGQSVVFLAVDPDLERRVVLKLYYANHDERWLESLLREGRILARLQCRYVARCFAIERVAGLPYLVLEYIPGTTLDQIISREDLSVGQAIQLISKIAVALKEIHALGLVHGDLKPTNIVIDTDGDPRVVDFGLASHSNRMSSVVRGTVDYIERGLLRGEIPKPDLRSDIYALGVIFYELLTKEKPTLGNPATSHSAFDASKIRPPEELNPRVTARASHSCLRCLANRSERYSSVVEFLADLQPTRKGWYLAAAATAAMLVMIAVAVWRWTDVPNRTSNRTASSAAEKKTVRRELGAGEFVIDSHSDQFRSVAIPSGSPVEWGHAIDLHSFGGNRRHPFPRTPAGTSKGRWVFQNLDPGIYQISATWTNQPNRSPAAPFTILDGSATRSNVIVNQEAAPVGFVLSDGQRDIPFQNLGKEVAITSRQLVVELTNVENASAENHVIADAILARRIGELPAPIIMDDLEAGFSTVNVPSGAALDEWGNADQEVGNVNLNRRYPFQYIRAGDTKARWVFQNLPSGIYQVSASWVPDPSRSSAAPYTILDGTTTRSAIVVNQELAPTDIDGRFQHLGNGVMISSGRLTVELTNVDNAAGNEFVCADAVRIQRIGD